MLRLDRGILKIGGSGKEITRSSRVMTERGAGNDKGEKVGNDVEGWRKETDCPIKSGNAINKNSAMTKKGTDNDSWEETGYNKAYLFNCSKSLG